MAIPGYPGPQYGYQPPMPQRSAIPKVIGILMIIFGSIGILGGLIGLAGNGGGGDLFGDIPEYKTWRTIELLTGVLGLAISILQLYAGIRLVGYKAGALGLAKAYAIVRIVTEIAGAILIFAWVKPMLDQAMPGMGGIMGVAMMIGLVFGLAWPIVVLALVTRPSAQAACNNQL